jgi:ABC-type dipeptide/oligopeptide/nickel transport system permease subunit
MSDETKIQGPPAASTQLTAARSLAAPDLSGEAPPPVVEAPHGVEGKTPRWAQVVESLRTFSGNRLALAGAIFLVAIILFSFVGPLIYKTDQSASTLLNANLPPSGQYPLGTGPEGYDMLGRLMFGGQSTLEVGLIVAVIATAFGTIWGALAGYLGGAIDAIMMRVVDMTLSIPFLFFAVLIATLLTPSLPLIIVAITAVSWPGTARIVRSETLSIKTRDYVTAASGFGSWHLHLVGRHILPNSIGAIVVTATLKVATAILLFATLAFLGLSVPPPATSWGETLTLGIHHLFDGYWWELWLPAALITLTVIAVSAIGDGFYDVISKRQAVSSK